MTTKTITVIISISNIIPIKSKIIRWLQNNLSRQFSGQFSIPTKQKTTLLGTTRILWIFFSYISYVTNSCMNHVTNNYSPRRPVLQPIIFLFWLTNDKTYITLSNWLTWLLLGIIIFESFKQALKIAHHFQLWVVGLQNFSF